MPQPPHKLHQGSLLRLPEGSRILVELPGPKSRLAKFLGRTFIKGAAFGEDLVKQEGRGQRSEDHQVHPVWSEDSLEVEDEPELVGLSSLSHLKGQVYIALRSCRA